MERESRHTIDLGNLKEIYLPTFHSALLSWGEEYFRVYPWRYTDEPYKVLIAEILLHRTKADQVVDVFQSFTEKYPDMIALAGATLLDMRRIIYPLGLPQRAVTILAMTKEIVEKHAGKVPFEKRDLLALSGVGNYIASAIRCFAFGLPEGIVDTNTVRVIGRLYGIQTKDSSRRNKRIMELIKGLVYETDPKAHNYALLDLANLVCTKRSIPDCQNCPLNEFCAYGQSVIQQ